MKTKPKTETNYKAQTFLLAEYQFLSNHLDSAIKDMRKLAMYWSWQQVDFGLG